MLELEDDMIVCRVCGFPCEPDEILEEGACGYCWDCYGETWVGDPETGDIEWITPKPIPIDVRTPRPEYL